MSWRIAGRTAGAIFRQLDCQDGRRTTFPIRTTIEVTSLCTGCSNFRGEVVRSGGTLEVNSYLSSAEGLILFASTIDVADGVSAPFSTKCAP